MQKLETIQHGAVLIRNGIVECVGPSNRVENLAEAKTAIEVNATGKLVMPAFVEPDASVYCDPMWRDNGQRPISKAHSLRTCSRQKLLSTGTLSSLEFARYGVVTAGTATVFANELKVVLKLLRTQSEIQSKPIRHRSIIAPNLLADEPDKLAEQITQKWLPLIRERRFSSILEIVSSDGQDEQIVHATERLAIAASAHGFSLRVRSLDGIRTGLMEMAHGAGVNSVIAPARMALLDTMAHCKNAVLVLGMNYMDDSPTESEPEVVRKLADSDVPIALSMGSPMGESVTRNMQHALHVAWCYYRLTAEEAICAATANAAWSLGTSQTAGSIEPGKPADLLIMDTPNYHELVRRPGVSSVDTVLRGGKVIHQRTPLSLD